MALTVAFEGISGCGKTTVIQMMKDNLRGSGLRVKTVDIDNTGYAPTLHAIARTYPFGHPIRTMLFWTLRVQQYDVMRAMSGEADIVLADRFWSSTFVFDVCGNGVPCECWKWIGRYVEQQPDITFLFEAPLSVARQRKSTDMMSDPNFAKRVEAEYSRLADRLSWIRVDATQESVKVADYCKGIILSRL